MISEADQIPWVPVLGIFSVFPVYVGEGSLPLPQQGPSFHASWDVLFQGVHLGSQSNMSQLQGQSQASVRVQTASLTTGDVEQIAKEQGFQILNHYVDELNQCLTFQAEPAVLYQGYLLSIAA